MHDRRRVHRPPHAGPPLVATACTRPIEAKEGVKIENENQTLATISFQNYFRMYSKLSGMTGTADTEAEEFAKIYNLDVRVIPTNRADGPQGPARTWSTRPSARSSRRWPRRSSELHKKGQPVLVGTVSIAKSEVVAQLPQEAGRAAQRPQRQAARARGGHRRPGRPQGRGHHLHQHGRPRHRHPARRQPRGAGARPRSGPTPELPSPSRGRRAAATRAALPSGAGRLREAATRRRWRSTRRRPSAEREEVIAAGGLFILGTERHESRRIDNQLRGRAGRQGDPGVSRSSTSRSKTT